MTYTHGMLGSRRIAGACVLAAGIVATSFTGAHASTITLASTAATVSVDGSHVGATIPGSAVGLNTAVWDGHLLDSATPNLVQQAGVQLLRFPGGSTADAYHWQTNSLTTGQGGYVNPNNSFTNFMQHVAIPSASQPMITVNYGSNAAGTGGGDPNEAAAWVRYANVTNHYGIKYWEVGNEVYGNGYYGSAWETDLHTDHSPTAYANNALQYIQAMKAVDPSIKVGLVLCAPGNWPDGSGPQNWNNTVLSIAGKSADFVSVHWYAQSPGQESDSGLLNSTSAIPTMVSQLRSEISQYTGTHASQMGIMVTESNSVSYNPGKQTTSAVNGLFLLQNYLTWLQQGVQNVTWWDLRNGGETGNNNSASLSGSTTYGDYGVVSSGSNGEPAANTPFPAFSALQLLKQTAPAGSTFLGTSSSSPDVRAFALRRSDGSVALTLINASPSVSYTVQPAVTNVGSIVSAQTSSFAFSNTQVTSAALPVQNGGVTVVLPAYSATVVTLTTGTGAAAPVTTPTATTAPTSTATATSTPSTTPTPTSAPTLTTTATPTPTTAPTSTATPTTTTAPTSTATPTPTSAPTATATPTSTATSTSTSATAPLVLGNFEGSSDGFTGNSDVTQSGPSPWSPTVALGTSSMWLQYSIPTAWSEAQFYKSVNLNLSPYTTLSASVFPKQPLSGAGVKVRFMVQGSDSQWYSSPYQTVPSGVRTTVSWNMSAVPRSPMKMVYVCWQFTSAATGTGNELWMDNIQAS